MHRGRVVVSRFTYFAASAKKRQRQRQREASSDFCTCLCLCLCLSLLIIYLRLSDTYLSVGQTLVYSFLVLRCPVSFPYLQATVQSKKEEVEEGEEERMKTLEACLPNSLSLCLSLPLSLSLS